MKIAVITEDGQTVSQHFGRAPWYLVTTVEDGAIVATETRPKAGHRDFEAGATAAGAPPEERHQRMAGAISDCTTLIAGGMGLGAFESLRARGIEPVLTDETDAAAACLRFARGDLPHLADRLHQGGHHRH